MIEVLQIAFLTIAIFMLVVVAVAKLVSRHDEGDLMLDGKRYRLDE